MKTSGHDAVQAALLDAATAQEPAVTAHLAGCAACRDFARAHQAAVALQGSALQHARRRNPVAVLRRAAVVLSVLLLGGALALVRAAPAELPASTASAAVEQPPQEVVPTAPAVNPGALVALARLEREVALDAHRDPRDDALARKTFGALTRWTAPHRTHPVRRLGDAASPLVFTSEDSP